VLKPIQSFSLIAIVLIALFGCEKKDPTFEYIPDGYYSGHFIYSEDTVFDVIVFDADTFSEVPSGGVMHQKFPCLVEGTYVIQDGKIDFSILKYPEDGSNCDPEKLLTGSYDLKMSGESLEFIKGDGGNKQLYKLIKVPVKPYPIAW
jgi:hypothetical protein